MSNVDRKKALEVVQPVGVIAVGVEGRASIDYLLSHGITDITAMDRTEIEGLPGGVKKVFGGEYDRDLSRFATIFRSPGIRPDHPELEKARKAGTRVTSALSYFMERCPCPVIGVTGTVGKGTASSIIAKALEGSGFTTHLGGNIGKSPLDFIDSVEPEHRVVLEISSFQAMDLSTAPSIGVILKTTSEHLDWHRDTEEYRAAKAVMLAGQGPGDVTIFNADSPGAVEIARRGPGRKVGFSLAKEVAEGFFLRGDSVFCRKDGVEVELPLSPRAVRLKGRFNLENILAGVGAAVEAGGGVKESCAAASSFESLPHRLELAATGGGIRYYNDSYATRPEAAVAAIEALEGPMALILGGSEKNADFGELVDSVVRKPGLVHVGLIGATASRIRDEIARRGEPVFRMELYDSLEEAMEAGASSLPEGGTVLLAPACASFGMFPNYKVRGERFRARAMDLANR